MRSGKYLAKRWCLGGFRFIVFAHPLLVITTYVLALTISLSGTYAWITARTAIEPVTFTTAQIELEINRDKTVIKRFADSENAVAAQFSLIGDVNDEVFNDWLEEYADDLETILTDADKAAPMSFAFRSYKLINGSDVPVYFRIDRARLSGQNHEIAFAVRCQIEGADDVLREGTLISGDDEVLYCTEMLDPGDAISVTFVAYLRNIESGKYTLSSEYAEIIQATNNAVFMSPGWEDVADELEAHVKGTGAGSAPAER